MSYSGRLGRLERALEGEREWHICGDGRPPCDRPDLPHDRFTVAIQLGAWAEEGESRTRDKAGGSTGVNPAGFWHRGKLAGWRPLIRAQGSEGWLRTSDGAARLAHRGVRPPCV